MSFELAELSRRLDNVINLGTIAEANHVTRKIRVNVGTLKTAWLPWPVSIGKNYVHWQPLRVGTQVVLAAPAGELAHAVVVAMCFTQAISTSNDEDLDEIEFNDGTRVSYSSATKSLEMYSVGNVHLEADGNLTLKASAIGIDGPVTQVGGDMTSDGISVQSHDHVAGVGIPE
jgi:phage baseplate assembly protein V